MFITTAKYTDEISSRLTDKRKDAAAIAGAVKIKKNVKRNKAVKKRKGNR